MDSQLLRSLKGIRSRGKSLPAPTGYHMHVIVQENGLVSHQNIISRNPLQQGPVSNLTVNQGMAQRVFSVTKDIWQMTSISSLLLASTP